MKHLTKKYQYHPTSVEFSFFTEDALLFDIETTGLSKKNHQIYLIGCAHRTDNEICIHQFFAEDETEEPQIILAFLSFAGKYHKLITFNGKRFDVPFLLEKCTNHNIDPALFPQKHLDIYLECKKIKSLLCLNSYKQKSIEEFLGINRDDPYDGGQLISVYKDFVKCRDSHLLELLLLHNYEDVAGMVEILPILSYSSILSGTATVIAQQTEEYCDFQGKMQQELSFTATLPVTIPIPLRIHRPHVHLFLDGDTLRGTLTLYQGTLRHFLPNYKDYVYLPQEDMVVLKSMASCILSDTKEKATPANCCIKKEGTFLCLPSSLKLTEEIYLFSKTYNATETYIQYDTELINNCFLEEYIKCLLHDLT